MKRLPPTLVSCHLLVPSSRLPPAVPSNADVCCGSDKFDQHISDAFPQLEGNIPGEITLHLLTMVIAVAQDRLGKPRLLPTRVLLHSLAPPLRRCAFGLRGI